jgi:hypothetical protein
MGSILTFFLLVIQIASALKFDLPATSGHGKNERCIRNFIAKDQLVVVTAIVSGSKGDGQRVNMHVRDKPIQAHVNTRFVDLRYEQHHHNHEPASVFDPDR